jgi:hypothetical protein
MGVERQTELDHTHVQTRRSLVLFRPRTLTVRVCKYRLECNYGHYICEDRYMWVRSDGTRCGRVTCDTLGFYVTNTTLRFCVQPLLRFGHTRLPCLRSRPGLIVLLFCLAVKVSYGSLSLYDCLCMVLS